MKKAKANYEERLIRICLFIFSVFNEFMPEIRNSLKLNGEIGSYESIGFKLYRPISMVPFHSNLP